MPVALAGQLLELFLQLVIDRIQPQRNQHLD